MSRRHPRRIQLEDQIIGPSTPEEGMDDAEVQDIASHASDDAAARLGATDPGAVAEHAGSEFARRMDAAPSVPQPSLTTQREALLSPDDAMTQGLARGAASRAAGNPIVRDPPAGTAPFPSASAPPEHQEAASRALQSIQQRAAPAAPRSPSAADALAAPVPASYANAPDPSPPSGPATVPDAPVAPDTELASARSADASERRKMAIAQIISSIVGMGRVPNDGMDQLAASRAHEHETQLRQDRSQRQADETRQNSRDDRQRTLAERTAQLREMRDPSSSTSRMRQQSLAAIRDSLAQSMPSVAQIYSDDRIRGLTAQQIEEDPMLSRLTQFGERVEIGRQAGLERTRNREDSQEFSASQQRERLGQQERLAGERNAAELARIQARRQGHGGGHGGGQVLDEDAVTASLSRSGLTPERQEVERSRILSLPPNRRVAELMAVYHSARQTETAGASAGARQSAEANAPGVMLTRVGDRPIYAGQGLDLNGSEGGRFRTNYAAAQNGSANIRSALAIASRAPGVRIATDRSAAAQLNAALVPLRGMVAQLQGSGIINPGELPAIEQALQDPRSLEGMTFGQFGSALGQFQSMLRDRLGADANALGVSPEDQEAMFSVLRGGGRGGSSAGQAGQAGGQASQPTRTYTLTRPDGQSRTEQLTPERARALQQRGIRVTEGP